MCPNFDGVVRNVPRTRSAISTAKAIPIVDIFAGPGGLGEGFSAFSADGNERSRPFRIEVSAERDPWAWQTLRLRAFFRQFESGEAPESYYSYLRGECNFPYTNSTQHQWERACQEARQLTLGEPADDRTLDDLVGRVADQDRPWVLIGGPPCQAYSLVGRARNRGIRGYVAENDERHFLYEHYLRLVGKYQPAAFVMENVKGLLSASVRGERLFHRILDDLQLPRRGGHHYRIIPLVQPERHDLFATVQPSDFIVRAELFGVPQARHRVILLGIRDDLAVADRAYLRQSSAATVRDVIADMPPLRSGTTSSNPVSWPRHAEKIFRRAARKAGRRHQEIADQLNALALQTHSSTDPGCGYPWIPGRTGTTRLRQWYRDKSLGGVVNHETRSHMDADLERYAFAATFAQLCGRSPRAEDFPGSLAPDHENWRSGKFVDRFKVQRFDGPSSTITSHLSKDGHYFIHPDPAQLRSITVREAARLQSFPDNYFFEGSRGKQFQQVGNAVPPWLAYQIAHVVYQALAGTDLSSGRTGGSVRPELVEAFI